MMRFEAMKKAASSSKVLIFLVFAAACTVALKMGMVASEWYQTTMANAFYALMGGYSLVEAARAVWSGKVKPEELAKDPAAALSLAEEEPED